MQPTSWGKKAMDASQRKVSRLSDSFEIGRFTQPTGTTRSNDMSRSTTTYSTGLGARPSSNATGALELNSSVYDDKFAKPALIDKAGIGHLPRWFDKKEVEARRPRDADYCAICEDKFKPVRNPIRHCKRCAKPVCRACSDQ